MRGHILFILLLFVSFKSFAYRANEAVLCHGAAQIPSLSNSVRCMGLVADGKSIPWKGPRKILFINSDTALVTAMGSWNIGEGKIWQLNFKNRKLVSYQLIIDRADRPHGLHVGQDNLIYYGDATRIYKFDLRDPSRSLEVVVDFLPDEYRNARGQRIPSSHPITEFVFAKNNDLIVNVGAPSNDCLEEFKVFKACHQRDKQAELRKYSYDQRTNSYHPRYTVIARGLRNSLGLLYNPIMDILYQAENGSDSPGTPDEINYVSVDKDASVQDYGWPFCSGSKIYPGYNNFKTFCAKRAIAPAILLPAHAAPLDMKYYNGKMFPEYKNGIFVSYHGHRESGSKIAVFKTDGRAHPLKEYETGKAKPDMLIAKDWNALRGNHPKGRPAGFGFDHEGAVYILDDKNDTLTVVAKTTNPNATTPTAPVEEPQDLMSQVSPGQIQQWENVFYSVFQSSSCIHCHSDIITTNNPFKSLENMVNSQWILPTSSRLEDQLVWVRMTGFDGARIMPPPPDSPLRTTSILEDWIRLN